MTAERLRTWAIGAIVPLALLAAYEVYTRHAVALGSDALAPPSAAVLAFAGAARDGSLWQATAFTLASAALGLALGAGAGVACGVALGASPRASRWSAPTVEMLRPVPSIALVPLAMLAFGFGVRMEVAVVAFATYWPTLVLTAAAVRQIDPRLAEVGRLLRLSPLQRVLKIDLPAVVPRLFVALRLDVAVALVVAVTVEIAANPNGMGYAMLLAQQSLDPALMLAWLAWIGVVGWVINAAMQAAEHAVARRMGQLQ